MTKSVRPVLSSASSTDRVALHLPCHAGLSAVAFAQVEAFRRRRDLFSPPPKYARHGCAYFGILFPAGCGGACPATAGAIGWELACRDEALGRSRTSPPSTASSLALFRCMCSLGFLAVSMIQMCVREGRARFGRVFRVAFESVCQDPKRVRIGRSRPFYGTRF